MSFFSRVARTGEIVAKCAGEALDVTFGKIDKLYNSFTDNLKMAHEIQVFSVLPYKKLLENNKSCILELISLETGKSKLEAIREIDKSLKHIDYYYEHYVTYYDEYYRPENLLYGEAFNRMLPTGVLVKIVPYNYPLWLAYKFMIPNICTGNPVLIRPPSTCLKLYSFLDSEMQKMERQLSAISFFPEDNLASVLSHKKIAGVSFTGSLSSGKVVGELAGKYLKKCVLELGGNDAVIVWDDVSPTKAAKKVFDGFLKSANGQ